MIKTELIKRLTASVSDAWSRGFSQLEAKDYAKRRVGESPTIDLVAEVYKSMDAEFEKWLKERDV